MVEVIGGMCLVLGIMTLSGLFISLATWGIVRIWQQIRVDWRMSIDDAKAQRFRW